MADPNHYDGGQRVGGTRLDEMLPPEELQKLIDQLTPDHDAARLARQQRFVRNLPTGVLEAELVRRRGEDGTE
jgi:hypothetical protein